MRALITGVTGFAGSHLAENLLAHKIEVVGTCLKGESRRNLAGFGSQITLREVSLEDAAAMSRLIDKYQPQWVFHLAALASVGASFGAPVRTMEVNLLGTMKLYESLRGKPFVEKIVFVSSADVFGPLPPQKMPIKPDYPLHPVSPYGASKAAADIISHQYSRAFGLPIVRIRAFNHTGPRQATGYVIPDFCSQISRIEKSKREGVIRVGNLSAKRDISDVRDIVEGYRLAAERGKTGDAYILASGKAHSMEDYLQMLVKHSTADISIKVDKRLLRPIEVPLLVGDISRSKRGLGYRPKYSIEKTLVDTLEYWRNN